MVRELVAARIAARGLQDVYPTPSHARLGDPALGLLPAAILDAIAGAACGPVTVDDGVTPPCERTCGASGVDLRWREVTIGDLLAHTAGLPPEAASWGDSTVPQLGVLRGHTREDDWAAEDAALRARYPEFAADIERTRGWLQARLGPDERVYFVSRYDRRDTDPQREWLGVYLTRCLARDPAGATDEARFKGSYSNTHYAILDSVVAHLGRGGRYAAEAGHPELHADSQLRGFLDALGLDGGVTSSAAIFRNPAAAGVPGAEILPEPRSWDPDERSYQPTDWEDKRPYCVWRGDRCDFAPWLVDKATRPRWDFAGLPARIEASLASQALTTGTGALSAEAPALLKVANVYAIGDDDILQGRRRDACGGACDLVMDKAGGLSGGRAYAISLHEGTRSIGLPGLAPDGRLSELGPRVDLVVTERGDVDVAVMVAQDADGKPSGTFEYSDLDEVVRYGLTRVDWGAVEAELAAQATQVVGAALDDAGDAHYWTADDTLTIRRGPPRGLATGPLAERRPYALPSARIGVDVAAVARALDRPGQQVYAWFTDGHVGRGEYADLRGDERPVPYVPAPGQTYRDLVAALVTPAGEAIAVYRDGSASFGTITDLAAHGRGAWTGRDPATLDALALAPDGRLFVVSSAGVEVAGLDLLVRDE